MWLKGNLHAHTDHSDGDATPEQVVDWYASHGFEFLAISDHNRLTQTETDRLLLIPATEISLFADSKPIHINALNIGAMPALPERAEAIVETLQAGVDAARSVGGLAMLNHPNFRWAFTDCEMAQVRDWHLLEIMNTSTDCNNFGFGGKPSVERMWDNLLSAGLRVFATATDDMHDLRKEWHGHVSPPGRAWVCVRAVEKSVSAIMSALASGDFYATTEVEFADLDLSGKEIRLYIQQEYDYAYTTHFIGAGGRTLAEAHGTEPRYAINGHEGYVRAKVYSSNGGWAWTQPMWVSADAA